jgi:dTDP-4-dehydrorhamnose 3,5-epimerase
LDVAVDVRRGSPTFGKHVAVELSAENHLQLFIPRGFAHGFSVLSPTVVFQYKCDRFYAPGHEGSIAWNDPDLGIDWGVPADKVIVSERDSRNPLLKDCDCLFDYSIDLYK